MTVFENIIKTLTSKTDDISDRVQGLALMLNGTESTSADYGEAEEMQAIAKQVQDLAIKSKLSLKGADLFEL